MTSRRLALAAGAAVMAVLLVVPPCWADEDSRDSGGGHDSGDGSTGVWSVLVGSVLVAADQLLGHTVGVDPAGSTSTVIDSGVVADADVRPGSGRDQPGGRPGRGADAPPAVRVTSLGPQPSRPRLLGLPLLGSSSTDLDAQLGAQPPAPTLTPSAAGPGGPARPSSPVPGRPPERMGTFTDWLIAVLVLVAALLGVYVITLRARKETLS